ncbi:hypothetical protein AL453_18455 [Salmonella enterica subsp. enterica serovar Poona]|nr:hypothetical protein [Salmonella enterica subsp. enterica serovar Poona]
MKTTYKAAILVATALTSYSALASTTPTTDTAHSGKDNLSTSSHSVNVATSVKTPPLVFTDNITDAAKNGTDLGSTGLISSSMFLAKSGHKYVLDTSTVGATASFSNSNATVDDTMKGLEATSDGNVYVQLSTTANSSLTPGVHNYTFVVSDYSA